jgi:hypothetical protein
MSLDQAPIRETPPPLHSIVRRVGATGSRHPPKCIPNGEKYLHPGVWVIGRAGRKESHTLASRSPPTEVSTEGEHAEPEDEEAPPKLLPSLAWDVLSNLHFWESLVRCPPTRMPGVLAQHLLIALAIGAAIRPTVLFAQRSGSTATADSLFAAQKWNEAATAYAGIVPAEPGNGAAWTNLGESYLQLRRFDEAIKAFATAASVPFRPMINAVNQARAHAEKREDAQVMLLIQRVIDGGAGGALRSYITNSTEFTRLANDPQWTDLVAKMKPCTTAPYRQFDFWIGDWDVYGARGGLAGHNLVTLEQDGCLLVEHWTSSAGGQTGTSFNYYDIRDKKWHQLYLDNSGNAGSFPAIAGTFENGKMVLLTDDVNNLLSRWTWYLISPGKVKQMQEVSRDHGQTWQTTWNSVYVRKGDQP